MTGVRAGRRAVEITHPDKVLFPRDGITKLDLAPPLQYVNVAGLPLLDRQFLVERQLISREHANTEGPRGVAFDDRESVSIMVNEEDHLRLQVMRSGLALDEAWAEIDRVDDALESRLAYAFHDQFGYLTACPTNVGTGMRASVMLHLPALGLTKQIEKVFRALQKINLVVRGLYGEGSRASGDFYQISNQVTLGKSESGALTEIREVNQQIIAYERQARHALMRENRQGVQDRVARAFGTLQSALHVSHGLKDLPVGRAEFRTQARAQVTDALRDAEQFADTPVGRSHARCGDAMLHGADPDDPRATLR